MPRRWAIPAAWLLLSAIVLGLTGRDPSLPGLYYDEAIHAGPARELLTGAPAASHLPGSQSIEVLGRWVPWMTMTYLGALKSFVLAPAFAVFGASVETLRLATTAIGLLGLLLTMLFAARLLGTGAAILAGALLALDPSFAFLSRHDFGPFVVAFACRAGALLAAVVGWRSRRPAALFVAGLLAGLGIYHKVDFAVSLVAALAGLMVAWPGVWLEAWRERRRRLVPAVLGLALGVAPLLPALPTVLRASGAMGAVTGDAALLSVVAMTLDGSYFLRLLAAGGRFEHLLAVGETPGTLFGPLVPLALVLLVVRSLRARPLDDRRRGGLFAAAASLVGLGLLFLLPGARHAHHVMNVFPFFHLAVAAALVALWAGGRGGAPGLARRGLVVAIVAVWLVSSFQTSVATWRLVERSGGHGWWSAALDRFAQEPSLGAAPKVVSLDWGFHENLRFLRPELTLREPAWGLVLLRERRQGAWNLTGPTGTVYLLHPPAFDLFGLGSEFLDALRALDPEAYRVRRHDDRLGETAFLSVRLERPHRLVYRGRFELELDPEALAEPGAVSDPGALVEPEAASDR